MKDSTVLSYQRQNCKRLDIEDHFSCCDSLFVKSISSRISIADYTTKIVERAITFEAWEKGKLIGLIAAYMNNPKSATVYITNVSVITSHSRKGIASKLLEDCISFAVSQEFKEIALEVAVENEKAILFYIKHGFEVKIRGEVYLSMNLTLKNII